ncbi:MAG TPA: hypothetical protein VFJ02_25695 [Vicinamibacterales bacterium]|nr:hypothetical protein [Vicinamibacterales bacterium]
MSDPIGLYAVIDKVVLEPSESAPERIQIWGAFALSDAKSGDAYSTPQTGYLYYRCQAGQETTCRNEWADLKSVAGKGIGVGFGGRYTPTGRVRKASEKPAEADPYPIRMGVVRMGSLHDHPAIVAALKQALAAPRR